MQQEGRSKRGAGRRHGNMMLSTSASDASACSATSARKIVVEAGENAAESAWHQDGVMLSATSAAALTPAPPPDYLLLYLGRGQRQHLVRRRDAGGRRAAVRGWAARAVHAESHLCRHISIRVSY